MLVLSKNNRVIYIDPFSSYFSLKKSGFRQYEKISSNLFVIRPVFLLTASDSRILMFFQINGLCHKIKALMSSFELNDDPVLWLARPDGWIFKSSFERVFKKRVTAVYDCADLHEGFKKRFSPLQAKKTDNKLAGSFDEKITMRQADLILAVSSLLMAKIESCGFNPVLVSNAAGNLFSPTCRANTKKRVRLVFTGALYEWTDLKLIKKICITFPKTDFFIAGALRKNKRTADFFKNRPDNLFYSGIIKYPDLPAYLKSMDIGVLPFKVTDLSKYSNPVKIYEYTAAGLPVISTIKFREFEHFKSVYMCNDEKSFFRCLEDIIYKIKSRDHLFFRQIQDSVLKNPSWEDRCDAVSRAFKLIPHNPHKKRRNHKIFLVIGFYGRGNLGDNCLLYEFARRIRKKYSNEKIRIILLSPGPDKKEIKGLTEKIYIHFNIDTFVPDTKSIVSEIYFIKNLLPLYYKYINTNKHGSAKHGSTGPLKIYVLGGYFHAHTMGAFKSAFMGLVFLRDFKLIFWGGGFGPFRLFNIPFFEQLFLHFLKKYAIVRDFQFYLRDKMSIVRAGAVNPHIKPRFARDPLITSLSPESTSLPESTANPAGPDGLCMPDENCRKVLLIPGNFSGTGRKLYHLYLLKALKKKGYLVDILFLRSPGRKTGNFIKTLFLKFFKDYSDTISISRDFTHLRQVIQQYSLLVSGRYHGLLAGAAEKKRLIPMPIYEKLRKEHIIYMPDEEEFDLNDAL
jgi:hypothetical protein